LLAQIARGSRARLLLEMPADTRLRVEVTPCA
jgi:hypothetical protein